MRGAEICDVHLFLVKKGQLIMFCKMPYHIFLETELKMIFSPISKYVHIDNSIVYCTHIMTADILHHESFHF